MSVMAGTTTMAVPRANYLTPSQSQQYLAGSVMQAGTVTTMSYPQTSQFLAPAPAPASYVPPMYETAFAAPGMMPGVATPVQEPAPQPPVRLTVGIPDPNAIESQKSAYSKGLDDQLRQGAEILNQQLKQQMDQLHQLGDQQKQKYFVQVDHEIKSQELGLVQQFKEQLLLVQQAAQQQKRILGQQACSLLLEYNQKKAQEDLMMEEYRIAKGAYDSQMVFTQEFQSLQQQQAQATQAAMTQQQAVEQHAAAAMAAIEEQRMQVAQQMAAQSRLVQSAETTAAIATSMYASPGAGYQYAAPMAAVGSTTMTQPTVSYSPAPMTTVAGMPANVSYTPAPASMPTVSYTPAPQAQYMQTAAPQTVTYAAPATAVPTTVNAYAQYAS